MKPLSAPDEVKRKPPVTNINDAVEGNELISVISRLRQEPSQPTTLANRFILTRARKRRIVVFRSSSSAKGIVTRMGRDSRRRVGGDQIREARGASAR